ncbi:serine/threonine-protein kinase [Actinoplanes sp. NEAU-A12]|uniref:Serine/threonine-protein kinase n=1 Tax=Actinoplanes sandaracinus TaxID=3045177 RepID=A0ABT6WYJ4_9ACTN|nr:serine/threonine-protein kinase [Actinoplanes sandaracinus]MDI6104801.1 serine/threonine-protein kinase [Actinoplanes sandaracinus]
MAGEEALGQDYVLHEIIGQGASGVVRRATHRDGGSPLAAKVFCPELAADRRIRTRFLEEEAVLRTLRHDAIVAVHDLILDRGRLALLMEYVDGPDLRRYLADQGGTLPPVDACAITADLAAGLAAAHAQGIVHMDLKPENILVDPHTQPPSVKISDFGVAVWLVDAGWTSTSIGGTAGYLAPDIRDGGPVTAAADMFALGVCLVEMLTGTRPEGTEAPCVADVPDPLRALVRRFLAGDPRDRPTARAAGPLLREALPALADLRALPPVSSSRWAAETVLRRRSPETSRPEEASGFRTKHRRMTIWAAAASGVLLLAAGAMARLLATRVDRPLKEGPPAASAPASPLVPSTPAPTPIATPGVRLGTPLPSTASPPVVAAYQGCPAGYVCLYPRDAGWNDGRPSHMWYRYGAYDVEEEGVHWFLNNQTGGAVARNCRSSHGTDCRGAQLAATWWMYNYDGYKSVLLEPS